MSLCKHVLAYMQYFAAEVLEAMIPCSNEHKQLVPDLGFKTMFSNNTN